MATRGIEFGYEGVDLNVSLFMPPLSPARGGAGIGLDLNVRPEETCLPANASHAAHSTLMESLGLEGSSQHPNNLVVVDSDSPYSPQSPPYTPPLSPIYTPLSHWVDELSHWFDPSSPPYSPIRSSPARLLPTYSHSRSSPPHSPTLSTPTPVPTSRTYNSVPLSSSYTTGLTPTQANEPPVLEEGSHCCDRASLPYVPLLPATSAGETSGQNSSSVRDLHVEISPWRLVESAVQLPSQIFELGVDSNAHEAGASARSGEMCVLHCTGTSSAPEEECTKEKSSNASDFECNICLEIAKEPVVTSCGHLFCWPCLYQWLHVHSDHKECPMCKGEVTESNITPIYGRGSSGDGGDGDLRIPPRPHACRVEGLRQRLFSQPSGGLYDDSWSVASITDENLRELLEMFEDSERQQNQPLLFRRSRAALNLEAFESSSNTISPASAMRSGRFHARLRNGLFLDELDGIRLQDQLPMRYLNSRLNLGSARPARNPSELASNSQNGNLLWFHEVPRNDGNNLFHHAPAHNPPHSDGSTARTAGISDVTARAVDTRGGSSGLPGHIYLDSQIVRQLPVTAVDRRREGQVSASGHVEQEGLGFASPSTVDRDPEYFPSVRRRVRRRFIVSDSLDAEERPTQRRRSN